MAMTKDSFDPGSPHAALVRREFQNFRDFPAAPATVGHFGEIQPFEDAYIRYEFHPLVSAVLWIADRFAGRAKRSAARQN
jgi:hypothetical protein